MKRGLDSYQKTILILTLVILTVLILLFIQVQSIIQSVTISGRPVEGNDDSSSPSQGSGGNTGWADWTSTTTTGTTDLEFGGDEDSTEEDVFSSGGGTSTSEGSGGSDTDGNTGDQTPPFCGDGIVQEGEDCDDGNPINTDACKNDCTFNNCGNNIIDEGEFCDDGGAPGGCNDECSGLEGDVEDRDEEENGEGSLDSPQQSPGSGEDRDDKPSQLEQTIYEATEEILPGSFADFDGVKIGEQIQIVVRGEELTIEIKEHNELGVRLHIRLDSGNEIRISVPTDQTPVPIDIDDNGINDLAFVARVSDSELTISTIGLPLEELETEELIQFSQDTQSSAENEVAVTKTKESTAFFYFLIAILIIAIAYTILRLNIKSKSK